MEKIEKVARLLSAETAACGTYTFNWYRPGVIRPAN